MCCFTQNILTLRLSVGGRTHGRTDTRKIFTQYSGISSCSLGSTDNFNLTPVSAQMNDESSAINVANMTNTNKGLDQPRLDEMNAEVTGDDK